MTARWDIFCKVVDNFGDAGVAWRLARQLAHEHFLDVRLWIDDPRSLVRMAPGVDANLDLQRVAGIEIRRWPEAFPHAEPAEFVVEAFGCRIPDSYAGAMARMSPAPVWFVLEYLSAEAWVDRSHGLPSPHPQLPLTRRFWFPGFTRASGSLLRERSLVDARDLFQRDQGTRAEFWASLSMAPPAALDLRISLFCYPDAAVRELFDTWADGDQRVMCMIPDGVAAGAIDAWTGGNVPNVGHPLSRGSLTLHAIPFLSQESYDRLLWACDVNFVRGEDSFVRAQWARRPFVWNVYPQAEDAHHRKLDAFLDRYGAALDPQTAAAVNQLFHMLNGAGRREDIGDAWRSYIAARDTLETHGSAWAAQLAALPDLATGLVKAAADRV
jgi:uncharacterized repeat protein (TIGR03837 family)